jgi:hypothetical protein
MKIAFIGSTLWALRNSIWGSLGQLSDQTDLAAIAALQTFHNGAFNDENRATGSQAC